MIVILFFQILYRSHRYLLMSAGPLAGHCTLASYATATITVAAATAITRITDIANYFVGSAVVNLEFGKMPLTRQVP